MVQELVAAKLGLAPTVKAASIASRHSKLRLKIFVTSHSLVESFGIPGIDLKESATKCYTSCAPRNIGQVASVLR